MKGSLCVPDAGSLPVLVAAIPADESVVIEVERQQAALGAACACR